MVRKVGTALVVGAGISGIRTALDLAETGYGVTLIDRADHLGGILTQLDYQFPTNTCGMCKMLPLVERDSSSQYCLRKGLFHENIEIMLSTELEEVSGEPGRFEVTLKTRLGPIDPLRCFGCGECAVVCPVEIPDPFNAGLSTRKAVYLPIPHAIPNSYTIDLDACTLCGECEKVCPTEAISLADPGRKDFRILVVDDELIVRDSLKEWLEDEGFSVDMAGSGREALEKIATASFDFMLADIKMPGMDGVELLKLAKESRPDLIVVMMTAYATVDTAVEAMKVGALDYLIKPFAPEKMIPMVNKVYHDLKKPGRLVVEVGAIVLSGGTDYFNPRDGFNPHGYGVYPNVVTSIELERILSGTGPSQGRLVRPSDGKPIKKMVWLQCVGSRDSQAEADFCSSVCCMFAIKEALLAKEKADGELEAAIYYMDMRTCGQRFQRYRDEAEEGGVHFRRCRVHSVVPDSKTGGLEICYVGRDGQAHKEDCDLVVLSVGARPAKGVSKLAEMTGLELNRWGFGQTEAFSTTRTSREGVVLSGSFSGLKDIGDSIIQAGSAALNASRVIHASGGGIFAETGPEAEMRDVSREPPRVLVPVCTCGGAVVRDLSTGELAASLKTDPCVDQLIFIDRLCTQQGWDEMVEAAETTLPNRILIGACLPYVYARKLKRLGRRVGLAPVLMDVVDLRTETFHRLDQTGSQTFIESSLKMGLAQVKRAAPLDTPTVPVAQRALVVGGGIAGLTAALSVAAHGFPVDLVECEDKLGGNLNWLTRTIEGDPPGQLLQETLARVEKHPLIDAHTGTRVKTSSGQVGRFHTTLQDGTGATSAIEHGVVILATGGTEARTTSYCYGQGERIITQKELEERLADKSLDPGKLEMVVTILCVDSREEPRNFCSRVCCLSFLKNALYLKKENPDLGVCVLYRDIMAPGFYESYYTEARRAGVIFIPYDLDSKPRVNPQGETVAVTAWEPLVGRDVLIEADLLVLATGVSPNLPPDLAMAFGAEVDCDGFFQEAESKWRPVDSLKEGVFACGLAHSPRSITESIATAEAAAQRTLRILSRESLVSGHIVAQVRHAFCSLCELCIETCPYGARFLDQERTKVLVNTAMCQGCGGCAEVCPNSASILVGYQDQQMFETIDAAIEGALARPGEPAG